MWVAQVVSRHDSSENIVFGRGCLNVLPGNAFGSARGSRPPGARCLTEFWSTSDNFEGWQIITTFGPIFRHTKDYTSTEQGVTASMQSYRQPSGQWVNHHPGPTLCYEHNTLFWIITIILRFLDVYRTQVNQPQPGKLTMICGVLRRAQSAATIWRCQDEQDTLPATQPQHNPDGGLYLRRPGVPLPHSSRVMSSLRGRSTSLLSRYKVGETCSFVNVLSTP
jgi:hypothetical protein